MSNIKQYRELRRALKRTTSTKALDYQAELRGLLARLTPKERQQLSREYPEAQELKEVPCSGRTAP